MISVSVLVFTLFVGATLATPSRYEGSDVFNLKTRAAIFKGNNNIVKGGIESSTSLHPSIVQMEFYWPHLGGWLQVCAGSLVTNMAVVSAARCTHKQFDSTYRPSNRLIRAGADYRGTGGELRNVHSVLNHPDFNTMVLDSDISIVRLSSPLIFAHNIKSISILPQNFNVQDNSVVIYAGWGIPNATVLLESTATTIDLEECERKLDLPDVEDLPFPVTTFTVSQNMFCADPPFNSTVFCFADIGGPVYIQNILAGVVYTGPCACSEPGYPFVSMNVGTFSDWIVANA